MSFLYRNRCASIKSKPYKDKYLEQFLNNLDTNSELIDNCKEESRQNKLIMEPYSSFRNKIMRNMDEKNDVLMEILNQIHHYKHGLIRLEDISKELGNHLITNCSTCKERYEKNCKENGTKKLTWVQYFAQNYYDLCSPDIKVCKNAEIIHTDEKLRTIVKHRQEAMVELNDIELSYKIALEQQLYFIELYNNLINRYKENNAVLNFKKNYIQRKINYIQLSVIFISAMITLFETIKPTISQYMSNSLLMIFPIALSTYIGLILAIGRFFKFDIRNEQIVKLIEKYSFIINKFIQKKERVENFDLKSNTINDWGAFIEQEDKDNITEILLKASEEKDMILAPKEYIYYKKKYTKLFLKELIESVNLDNLTYLVSNTNDQNSHINRLVQDIVVKKSFFKYYLCCGCCFGDREYVDYEKVMLIDSVYYSSQDIERQKEKKNYMREIEKHSKRKGMEKYSKSRGMEKYIKRRGMQKYSKRREIEEYNNRIFENKKQTFKRSSLFSSNETESPEYIETKEPLDFDRNVKKYKEVIRKNYVGMVNPNIIKKREIEDYSGKETKIEKQINKLLKALSKDGENKNRSEGSPENIEESHVEDAEQCEEKQENPEHSKENQEEEPIEIQEEESIKIKINEIVEDVSQNEIDSRNEID